jgi:hypothetical protein
MADSHIPWVQIQSRRLYRYLLITSEAKRGLISIYTNSDGLRDIGKLQTVIDCSGICQRLDHNILIGKILFLFNILCKLKTRLLDNNLWRIIVIVISPIAGLSAVCSRNV